MLVSGVKCCLKEFWAKFQNFIMNNNKIVSIIILFVVCILSILIVSKVICITIKKLNNLVNKLNLKINKVKKDINTTVNITQSLIKSDIFNKKDITTIYNELGSEVISNSQFLAKTGIALMFPSDVLKWYLGKLIDIKPLSNNFQEYDGLKILVKQIIFVSNKLTRVTIEISNIGQKIERFNMNKEKLKRGIELKINSNIIKYEDTNSKEFLYRGTLKPHETKEIQFSFNFLDENQIRELRNVDCIFKRINGRKNQNFSFSFPIQDIDLEKMDDVVFKKFDLLKFMQIMSLGGFVFFAVILNTFILFIGCLFGGWFKLITVIFSLITLCFSIVLNYKYINIIFDYFNIKDINKFE